MDTLLKSESSEINVFMPLFTMQETTRLSSKSSFHFSLYSTAFSISKSEGRRIVKLSMLLMKSIKFFICFVAFVLNCICKRQLYTIKSDVYAFTFPCITSCNRFLQSSLFLSFKAISRKIFASRKTT